MLILLSADATAVSKTTGTVSPETKQSADKDKGQNDSGSDYGGDWSEDEWNDAQVQGDTSEGGRGGGQLDSTYLNRLKLEFLLRLETVSSQHAGMIL